MMEKNNKNAMSVFENTDFGAVRVVMNEADEPMFCLADVCRVLDIKNPRDCKTRLNDKGLQIVNLHTVGNADGIISAGNPNATFINESNLYKCIFQSRTEKAEAFQEWVTSEVLPSIRKTGRYETKSESVASKTNIQLMILERTARICNFSDSARLEMMQKFAKIHDVQMCLPNYVTSKGILRSATELLSKNGVNMSTRAFNTLLESEGFITTMQRTGSSGSVHKFRNITKKGLEFGENQVSPQSPNQTQPMWYEDKFSELCGMIGVAV